MQSMEKNITHICEREEILTVCMEHCSEGFILLDKNKKVLAYNRRADRLLKLDSNKDDLAMVLGKEPLHTLFQNGCLKKEYNQRFLNLESFPLQKGELLLLIHDLSIEENMKYELNNVREINQELQHIFETYSDNTLYVCDHQGKTLWAGSDIAQNCGVSEEYLMEHSVMELEKERVFYPSVSARVLKSKKAEIVTQITAIGKTGISIGIPVFNRREEMTHIISLTRDLGYTLKLGQLLSELKRPKEKPKAEFAEMVACSQASIELMGMIRNVAKIDVTVLIQAEAGSGKDMTAHMIHKLGRRKVRPFEKMDCQSIPQSKQERILFGSGQEQGLLAKVGNGILYIDEVQEMSLKCQKKLSDYLHQREESEDKMKSRLLFSTSVDLKEAVSQKGFYKELYQQISIVTLTVQPLRKRREDIPLLIKHFTKQANEKYQVEKSFSKEAAAILEAYIWNGNVRELQNVVEKAVVTSSTMLIGVEDLPEEMATMEVPEEEKAPGLAQAVARLEKKMIQEALEECGNASKAAKVLGVNQSTISRKMQKYGIEC